MLDINFPAHFAFEKTKNFKCQQKISVTKITLKMSMNETHQKVHYKDHISALNNILCLELF